jgi:ubiquinone/menaquinone biosynthesis C-methylase UbiE
MATKEHWEIDPWDQRELWLRVVGKEQEDPEETATQACSLFAHHRGRRCLEIGAGVGRLLKPASFWFKECLGVDSSAPIVAAATRNLLPFPRCRVILNDGLKLPFPDKWFDFVYSFTCFQHMPDLDTVRQNIKEAFRVLRRGGVCKVQTVEGTPDTSYFDGWVFPSPEAFWEEFQAVGFVKVEAEKKDLWIWITVRKP